MIQGAWCRVPAGVNDTWCGCRVPAGITGTGCRCRVPAGITGTGCGLVPAGIKSTGCGYGLRYKGYRVRVGALRLSSTRGAPRPVRG